MLFRHHIKSVQNIPVNLEIINKVKLTFYAQQCIRYLRNVQCLRPYHVENTGSRPITEVKQRRAWLVLGWVTAWEY